MTIPRRIPIRWKAIGPLGLVAVLLGAGWVLFSDLIARVSLQEAATQVLGTQVDIGWVRIHELDGSVEIGELAVADPFDHDRNLAEVGHLLARIDPRPLLQKKIVITELRLERLALGTGRTVAARPVPDGPAGRVASAATGLAARLAQPGLGWSGIDSVREIIVDPSTRATVAVAGSLTVRIDSVQAAVTTGLAGLDLDSLLVRGRSVATRVAAADPVTLGLGGMRQLVGEARAVMVGLDSAERGLDTWESGATRALAQVTDGIAALRQARLDDYRRVESMIGIPSFDAADLGGALFGGVSLSYLRRALYWADVVRSRMPPGLLPRSSPGPVRLRAPGTNVEFPEEDHYPAFLLVAGHLDDVGSGGGREGGGPAKSRHTLELSNLSTAPTLVADPAMITLHSLGDGSSRLDLSVTLDHRSPRPRDSLAASARVNVPAFGLPGLPLRVAPGWGTTTLTATLVGDDLVATWELRAPQVRWVGETDSAPAPSPVADMVRSVMDGTDELRIFARVRGTGDELGDLEVRSNIDGAIARRMRQAMGEVTDRGRARARAAVDRLVARPVAVADTKAGNLTSSVEGAGAEYRRRLVEVRNELESQVNKRAGGLGGLIGRRD